MHNNTIHLKLDFFDTLVMLVFFKQKCQIKNTISLLIMPNETNINLHEIDVHCLIVLKH